MSLPRFDLPDEDEDDDSTAPAQFVLKLPPSYVRRLSSLRPAPTPVPWIVEIVEPPSVAPDPAPSRSRAKLVAVLASAAACLIIAAGLVLHVEGAAAETGDPVGIARHAPKSLERSVRASARQSGATPHVPTVSIESLHHAHAHAHAHARRRR